MREQCLKCHNKICAKRVPIFSGLAPNEITEVTDLIIRKVYKKGEVLIREDEVLDRLVIINTGTAKGYRYSIEGKEQILHLYTEGEFFGEKNLIRQNKATYDLIALSEVHVCTIHIDDFQQLIRKFPLIGFKVMEVLAERLERLEHQIAAMGTGTVEARVAQMIVEFAHKFGVYEKGQWLITLPLNREGIASYIGVTRETVSRTLNQFQDKGMIVLEGNKKILVPDIKSLE